MIPTLFGFMAYVPPPDEHVSLQRLSSAVRQTLVIVGMQGKSLAERMGLRESHLSRQLNEHGINLWRLIGAGREFWLRFLPMLVEMVGLDREDVLTVFNAEDDKDRDERELKQDEQIAELQRQLAEVLRRLPTPAEDRQAHVA